MKTCSKCKLPKEEREFYKQSPKGLRPSCKSCHKITVNLWRRSHLDVVNKLKRKQKLKKMYGITPDKYAEMLQAQEGLCAICEGPMKRPCMDHDHISKKVRELLCHACNIAIGMLRDSPALARRAADYLEKHTAS